MDAKPTIARQRWLNRTVWGIVVATFFSDVSHEMATAVLPMFLAAAGFGPLGLGLMEGVADLLGSLAKLAGGVVGHHVQHKKPWAAIGYLITAVCTSLIGLAQSLSVIISLRTVAWMARGFRGPLRDFLLADAVEPTHYGRAYGFERAGDMLGAVVGPLLAALAVWLGTPFRLVIMVGIIPGALAAASLFFVAKEREELEPEKDRKEQEETEPTEGESDEFKDVFPDGVSELSSQSIAETSAVDGRAKFPPMFWLLLIGVLLFGLGDFSRTLLIWLAARALGGLTTDSASSAATAAGILSATVLLYAMHNAVSALAAYPAGHWGDRRAKLPVLLAGYALGVVTNLLLAFNSGSIAWLVLVFVLSGIYIAIEETLEKAVMAELLPRNLRGLGLGLLAGGNAIGDMASSLYVGALLQTGHASWAFGLAAAFGGFRGRVDFFIDAASEASGCRRLRTLSLRERAG